MRITKTCLLTILTLVQFFTFESVNSCAATMGSAVPITSDTTTTSPSPTTTTTSTVTTTTTATPTDCTSCTATMLGIVPASEGNMDPMFTEGTSGGCSILTVACRNNVVDPSDNALITFFNASIPDIGTVDSINGVATAVLNCVNNQYFYQGNLVLRVQCQVI